METAEEYLARKHREVAMLRAAPVPRIPDAPWATGASVLVEKHKAALAQDVHRAARLYPATNWTSLSERHVGDHRFRYGYQRFDLSVDAPPVYPDLPGVRSETYCRSGMSALAALCQSFDRVAGQSCPFLTLRDAYFEAQYFVEHYCKSLTVDVSEDYAGLQEKRRALHVLHLDSISSEDPGACLVGLDKYCVLAVIDTSCHTRNDPLIFRMVTACLDAGVPVALVRSHLKLDTLGMELGQLGSVVLCAPPTGSGLADALDRMLPDVVRVFGFAPSPVDFFPVADTVELLALSAARVKVLRRNTVFLERAIQAILPQEISLRSYHHGMFLTLHNTGWETEAPVRDVIARLVAGCKAAGGTLIAATSFGFDFCAIQDVLDLSSKKVAIRLAPSDEVFDRFDPLLSAVRDVFQDDVAGVTQ